MAARDWRKVSEDLRRYTNLPSSPVAIKLLKSAAELHGIEGMRQLTNTAPCQMAAWARYYREDGVVGASAEGVKCVWGSACTGLINSPQRLNEGDVAWRYAKDTDAGKHIQDNMGVLGDRGKLFDALIMAPLEHTPVDPDVIAMYLTPAQALRIIIAYAFWSGEEVRSVITGQSSLCSSIAHAYREKNLFVDLPCVGDRTFGLVQEHEMVLVFHESRTEQIIDGLKETEGFSSHPFKPFLRWPVIFAPDMEPRRTELD